METLNDLRTARVAAAATINLLTLIAGDAPHVVARRSQLRARLNDELGRVHPIDRLALLDDLKDWEDEVKKDLAVGVTPRFHPQGVAVAISCF